MIIARKTSIRRTNRAEIKNEKSEATVYLYGPIGGWFGVDQEEFVKEFNAIDAKTIHIRIDSEGGDVFAARAMKTAIMQHPSKTIAHIDGLAASAASFLAMGADEVEIVDGGFIMIHRATSLIDVLGFYDVDDLQDVIDDLTKEQNLHEKINESIAQDYVKKTGMDLESVQNWMAAETWFTAQEAMDNKFVDRVYDGEPVEGSYDLSIFGQVPDEVKNRNTKVSKRAVEKALRDAGLSNKAAKKILADGLDEELRDEADIKTPEEDLNQRDVDSAGDGHDDETNALLNMPEFMHI